MKVFAQIAVLLLLGTITFLVNNHVFDATLMEARNFVTAREILLKDNWLLPTMNDELRLAKPPMPTWFSALTGQLAGSTDNLTAMRFPAGLAGITMVLFLFYYVRSITEDKQLPFVTGCVLASAVLVIQMARTGSWDIFCHMFMVGALWWLSLGIKKQTSAYGAFSMVGLLLGLSFMSKGPVAFYAILLPFLIAFGVVYRFQGWRSKWKEGLLALVICILLAGWWPLYIYLAHPEAAAMTAEAEANAWVDRHVQPFWYYWPFLFFIGLWSLFALAALIVPYARQRINSTGAKHYLFFLIWVAATLVLLSVIPEKKERYLLPIMIPVALLAGSLLNAVIQRFQAASATREDRWLLWVHGSIMSVAGLGMPVAYWILHDKLGELPMVGVIIGLLLFVGIGALNLYFTLKQKALRLFYSNLGLIVLAIVLLLPLAPAVSYTNPLYRDIAEVRKIEAIESLPWYSVGTFDLKRVYYVGRAVAPWDYQNDEQLLTKLPLAVFTDKPPSYYFHGELLKEVELDSLDVFHYHRTRKNRERYISILRLKKN